MATGYLDLLGADAEPESTGATQDLMLTRVVPLVYERWWRPALGARVKGLTGPGMDEEMRIARLLLGLSDGHRVLDVACGPGNFTRSFGRAVGDTASRRDRLLETMLERGARDTERRAPTTSASSVATPPPPVRRRRLRRRLLLRRPAPVRRPVRGAHRHGAGAPPGGRIALMTSVRRQVTLPPLKPLVERTSGMRVFEHDEIVAALRVAASPTSTSASRAGPVRRRRGWHCEGDRSRRPAAALVHNAINVYLAGDVLIDAGDEARPERILRQIVDRPSRCSP